ncbi:element excision factor XisH family protein [Lusitaniella coriacea LEGE 07167]|nr:element excision factor XisH family protein [Lusitaniella coriacea]
MGGLLLTILIYIKVGGAEMYVDLTAEKLITAQKAERKIAVEIKSFLRESEITEFHLALGQFSNYRLALKQKNTRSSFISGYTHRYL